MGEHLLILHGCVTELLLFEAVLHDVLFHDFVVELKRVSKCKTVINLSASWFNNKGPFIIDCVVKAVVLSFSVHLLKLLFVSPCGLFLVDQTSCW